MQARSLGPRPLESTRAVPALAPRPRKAPSVRTAGEVETDALGRIETLDPAAARLLRTSPSDAKGRFLLGFIDPVSQRQFLENALRARRSPQPLSCRAFVRPRKTLPLRCEVSVEGVPARPGHLRWRLVPLSETRAAHASRRADTSAALEAREHEARRIARDLHDEAGQMLAALHLAIDDVSRDVPEPARTRVLAMRGLVSTVEEQLRRISHGMRPPALEGSGLAAALEALAAGVKARTDVRISLKAAFRGRLQEDAETHLYRIAQEAVTNALRHGMPGGIRIRLERRGPSVALSVADDGAGFDTARALGANARGLGLRGIRERVDAMQGTLSLLSRPGKGCTVMVTVPLWP